MLERPPLTIEQRENLADFQKSCSHKRPYSSKRKAKRRARQVQMYGGPPVETYRCRHCGFWHAGHAPGSGKRPER